MTFGRLCIYIKKKNKKLPSEVNHLLYFINKVHAWEIKMFLLIYWIENIDMVIYEQESKHSLNSPKRIMFCQRKELQVKTHLTRGTSVTVSLRGFQNNTYNNISKFCTCCSHKRANRTANFDGQREAQYQSVPKNIKKDS